ncbi:MAG: prolyl aminopeptidase [Chitinivibrionia bacterium]|nr:prolyl aminopeptidase [Chitinivibrionia bacterium]
MWPEIEPFKTGYLKVSDLHELYYELCGNPDGKPVFMLHGGPGGSSSPYMRRLCNPEKFLIVLYDQRGSGKSKPYAETRENTTPLLVEDIEALRTHLGLDSLIVFGGSWGATLGLAYAEAHPEHVSGLVLRGVFTATKEEIDHFYHGGVKPFFPETYEKFVSALPEPQVTAMPEYLFGMIEKGDSAAVAQYTRAWAEYEIKLSGLNVSDDQLRQIMSNFNPVAFGVLENYYMANKCFLEEGQLLRDAARIKHIPTVIVNGRYDMICPPITAYRLHLQMPGSKLVIAEGAGHWMGEPPIQQELLRAMRNFE